jgi:hypothetical protein
MNIALTAENRKTLKRLLKLGRWGNESEIVRYGLHLVKQEVVVELGQSWPKPISSAALKKWYTQDEPKAERELERKIVRGSKGRIRPEAE